MLLRYEENIKLTANNFSYDGRIKPSSILDIFQSVASDHAELIGAGFADLMSKDLIWILLKIRYDVIKPIPFMAKIKAVTSPRPKNRMGYVRDYFIYSENGELLVKGSSFWCLASFSQRKYSRPVFDYVGEYDNTVAYEEDFERLKPFAFENPQYVCSVSVLDTDRNRHTNNVKYTDYAINGLNKLIDVKSFSIAFISETMQGDKIEIGYQEENDSIVACGRSNGKDTFVAKFSL